MPMQCLRNTPDLSQNQAKWPQALDLNQATEKNKNVTLGPSCKGWPLAV